MQVSSTPARSMRYSPHPRPVALTQCTVEEMLSELLYMTGYATWPPFYKNALWQIGEDLKALGETLRNDRIQDLRLYGNRVEYVADLAIRESSLAAYFLGITDGERDYLGLKAGTDSGIWMEEKMLRRLETSVFPGAKQIEGLLAHCRVSIRLTNLLLAMWHVEFRDKDPPVPLTLANFPGLDWLRESKAREHPDTYRWTAFCADMHHWSDIDWPGTFPDMLVEFAHKDTLQSSNGHALQREEPSANSTSDVVESTTIKRRPYGSGNLEMLLT